jgi:SAM-dependent methyltransferase
MAPDDFVAGDSELDPTTSERPTMVTARPAEPVLAEPNLAHPSAAGSRDRGQAQPAASAAYRSHAGQYDRRTEAFHQWRERLVELLPAQPGDTVLDVGCGTGLCIPLLQDKVGPTGTIVGIDASEQMLEVAGEKVATQGWDNVRLVSAPAEHAPIGESADAALFCAVHDVLQCRASLTA